MNNEAPLYSETEISAINQFLQESIEKTAAERSFLRPINPEEQARPEVERLRKKRKADRKAITPEDLNELEEAAKSPFAPTFQSDREDGLEQLRKTAPAELKNKSMAVLLLKHFSNRLCAAAPKPTKSSTLLISSSGLAWLLNLVHLPMVCAPIVVWLATKMRDIGVPAFCDALKEYLKEHGIA